MDQTMSDQEQGFTLLKLAKTAGNYYCLVVGNPGVGKSTLLNCLMSDSNVPKDQMFRSGISIGRGLTDRLHEKLVDGVTYLDTPGLEDMELRKQAAEAITHALKKNGNYRVLFVITLESGRIRPTDVAAMKIVLENAPDIENYGVIVNKLSKRALKIFDHEIERKKIIAEIKTSSQVQFLHPPLYLPLINELDDEDDTTAKIPNLLKYIEAIPVGWINKNNVTTIPYDDTFERYTEQLEDEIQKLKSNNEELHKEIRNQSYEQECKIRISQLKEENEHEEENVRGEQIRINSEMKEQEEKKPTSELPMKGNRTKNIDYENHDNEIWGLPRSAFYKIVDLFTN